MTITRKLSRLDNTGGNTWAKEFPGPFTIDDKYPMVIDSWRNKWCILSAYFKYPDYVRTAIYTSNAVEAVHRQFRKLTKTKGGFANENSFLKLLFAGKSKASERWTHPVQNWNLKFSELMIHFPERLGEYISL